MPRRRDSRLALSPLPSLFFPPCRSQSAKGSILSVHVAHSLDQLVFFVDNSPWSKVFPRSRSAQLLNMLINKVLKAKAFTPFNFQNPVWKHNGTECTVT